MPGEPQAAAHQDVSRAELEELRQGLLPIFASIAAVAGWVWFGIVVYRVWDLGRNVTPTAVLLPACLLAYGLRRKHYKVACWVLLLGTIAAFGLFTATHPFAGGEAYGVLAIIVANALLGAPEALIVAVLLWLAGGTVQQDGAMYVQNPIGGIDNLVLYLLVLGVAWLAARPQQTAVETALAGWTKAREAVREARERRGELFRVVRALDEATSRIEHMNTELVAKRQEADLARALKARFVATVSHELRGPLNLILGFSRLMALSPEEYPEPLPPSYHADVDAIYRNSQHLAALLDDILDLSQIEAERLPLVKDRVDLEEDVVRKVIEVVRPLAERKGLRLRQELAGNLPWILADQVRLRQALLNLLTNAIRLTETGEVVVSTTCRDDALQVSVRDTGPGIAAEDMPKLFREFHQTRRAATRESRGSGLGLSISKQLIELHSGTIWAESEVGRGTAFHFTVPLPGHRSLHAFAGGTREVSPPASRRQTCLVVHDEPSVVRLLARYLEGYRVLGLPSEEEVIGVIEETRPRAIITTRERGRRIAERLLQVPYDVPIITCGMPRMKDHSQWEGILSYLVKPFTAEMLAGVMKQVERNGETTVLLVDDDPDAVRLMESMLTRIPRPYRILRAFTGQQALERMQTDVPDVVLMDEIMPELTGRQTLERMRADERLRNVPVVIVSAYDWARLPIALHTPISVRRRDAIDVASAAKCLRGLLDELSPRYLPVPAESQPSPAATLD